MKSVFVIAALAAGLVFMPAPAALAACKPVLKQKKVQLTEAQARKAAIAAWSATAKRKHGAGFASWSKAGDKKMNCKQIQAAKRQQQLCVAIGRPCSN